jgi:type II secretion system protein H
MLTTKKTRAGFTLIEVMIVVAIIGITSAAVFVSLSASRSTRGLDRASREVMASLREAQNYALSGRSANISDNNTYFGLQISSATDYSVTSSTSTISSYTLKDGVTFSSGATTIEFTLPRGDVRQGGAPLAGSYRISLTKGGSSLYVCLYPTGRMVENGPNSTCP